MGFIVLISLLPCLQKTLGRLVKLYVRFLELQNMAAIRDHYTFLHPAARCVHQQLIIFTCRIGVGIAAYHKDRYGDPCSIEAAEGKQAGLSSRDALAGQNE